MSEWNGFGELDLSDVEAESGRRSMRPGSYICKITAAEIRKTKDGKGRGLVVEFAEIGGGGTADDWINVANPNKEAERIGRQKLKALLISCGHPNPNKPSDVASIVGRTVGVRIEPGEDWTDKEGRVRPGGGKVRRSGAYFPPNDNFEQLGPSPSVQDRSPQTAGTRRSQTGAPFNDDIPF